LILALCAASLARSATGAGPAGVHRTTLQSLDFPGSGYRTVTVRTVIDPGSMVPSHRHPGIEIGYLTAGRARLDEAGAEARTLVAGDSFAIPSRTVHSVRNSGRGPLTILSTYVVDKAAPLSIPSSARR
jgi:quercetin dioxygenase-like cupin family protein